VRRACGRGLGVVSGKETKTGEGAARVVEPRDTDGVRSLIGYGILLYFFYFPFFSFVTFFFLLSFFSAQTGNQSQSQATRQEGRFGLSKKNNARGGKHVTRHPRHEPKKEKKSARRSIPVFFYLPTNLQGGTIAGMRRALPRPVRRDGKENTWCGGTKGVRTVDLTFFF
jgi:hypothetical protein